MDFGINNSRNIGYPMDTLSISNVAGTSRITNEDINADSVQKTAKSECQTCKSRKYVDASNESDVSFKTPGHIDPSMSASVVLSHEQEHVSNAVQEGNKTGNQLISASVSLKMSVCPECGRGYVAGGVTSTTIKYNETNPYDAGRKIIEGSLLRGQNVDMVA